jgi:hypothetical protein
MRFARRLSAAVLVLPLFMSAGCQSLMQDVDDSLLCVRNCSDSWHAWKYYRTACPDESWYPHHYGKGFRAGYRNVAEGGDGCPPTLPPSCYWSVCYQNPAGQAKVQEWFRGWVFGANAARIDGVADYNQIMTSERLFGRCGPQSAPGDVHYTDHGSGWSSDGNHTTPTPTPASPIEHPPAPGAEIPSEPYFPEAAPGTSGPQAAAPHRELLQLMESPDGPVLK